MQRKWLAVIPLWIIAGLAWANEIRTLDLGGGTSMELVRLEAGTFTQGSPAEEEGRASDETPLHPVTLSKAFYIARTAVTLAQWQRFAVETGYRTEAESGASGGYGWDGRTLVQQKQYTWKSPGFSQSPDDPICLVTWADARQFCQWLQKKSNSRISLPTEAQWEYACRSGTTTAWHDGSTTVSTAASRDNLAWHKGNAGNGTRATTSILASKWGLYIGGNVSEWCEDWYAPYSTGPATDPEQTNDQLSDKPRRVLRGGSWNRELHNTRSAARFRADPHSRNANTGFRVVMTDAPPVLEVDKAPSNSDLPSWERQPQPPSPLFNIGGLACTLIPLGAIAAIIIAVVRAANRRSSSGSGQSAPPRQPPPPDIRMADDGFWLTSRHAPGTILDITYMLLNGARQTDRVTYQPGPQGQFIFTGSRPSSVSVLPAAAMAGAMMSGTHLYDHQTHSSTLFDNDRDNDRGTTWQRSEPPDNPAAY